LQDAGSHRKVNRKHVEKIRVGKWPARFISDKTCRRSNELPKKALGYDQMSIFSTTLIS